MIGETMKPTPGSELEAVIVEAEGLAAGLEKSPERSARLFARVLMSLANDARCVILAESSPETLMRLHLRIETTMRLADADHPGSWLADGLPPSQRPTVPCPPHFSPEAEFSLVPDPSFPPVPSASTSQVRRKTGWAELSTPGRRRANAR